MADFIRVHKAYIYENNLNSEQKKSLKKLQQQGWSKKNEQAAYTLARQSGNHYPLVKPKFHTGSKGRKRIIEDHQPNPAFQKKKEPVSMEPFYFPDSDEEQPAPKKSKPKASSPVKTIKKREPRRKFDPVSDQRAGRWRSYIEDKGITVHLTPRAMYYVRKSKKTGKPYKVYYRKK